MHKCNPSRAMKVVISGVLFAVAVSVQAQIATGEKFLGNVINEYIPSDFTTYWNQVTPENAAKWGSVEATRDTMDWHMLDNIYTFAGNNGFPVRYHTLVWGSQEPGWVADLAASEQLNEVTEWIQEAG